MKRRGFKRPMEGYRPIHMPANTAAGVILAALSTALGFALVWYIWWLAALSLAAIVAAVIAHSFRDEHGEIIPPEEVARFEARRGAAPQGTGA